MNATGYEVSLRGYGNVIKLVMIDVQSYEHIKKSLNCMLQMGESYGISIKLL